MFSSFLSIFANFRVENLSDQVKCCEKGVTRQNTNLSKKCCEKGAVLRKGGVAKRATSGVIYSVSESQEDRKRVQALLQV